MKARRYPDVIKDELAEVKAKFGDARKTEITYLDDEIGMFDLIEEEDVVVTISHLGYIKRTSASEYRAATQGRTRCQRWQHKTGRLY